MADGDGLTRLLENFYSALFERKGANPNSPVTTATLNQENMGVATDDGQFVQYPAGGVGTGRWYGDLTLAGADQDVDASIYKAASTPSGRVRYGAGVVDETAMTWVFRVRPDWASGSPPVTNPTLFDWRDSGTSLITMDWNSGTWRLRRGNGTVATHTAADTFTSGAKVTLGFKLTATQLGISIDGGAFSMAAGVNIPVLAATQFDLLTQATNNDFRGGLLWCVCVLGALTDAQIAALHALGDTDPYWSNAPLAGSHVSFQWDGD